MKNVPLVTRSHRMASAIVVGLCVVFQCARAAELKEARVTYVVNEVKLLPPQAAPRPAAVSDQVRDGTAVRTGTASRSELTFTDLTITRLGADTIFSFNEGTRNLDLKEGAILLRVPKNAGGAKITTAAVTAAITGTTVMMEYHPHGFIKAISLEGTFRMYLKQRLGESVLVHAGQMIIMRADATRLPDPVDVDIQQLLKSSLLIVGFPPLPSADLIAQAAQTQAAEKASGELVETNLVIFGSGTVLSLLDQTNIDQISQATVVLAPPPPSEFGPPSVISSPVPYLITSGTVITTDPTITTNGVTDFGKIWRGPAIDGPLSSFLFGSTSTFDTTIGLETETAVTSGAVFKFTSLELTGNPTVSTTNGEINLTLVGVNGITSGTPGGTLTFAGISALLLATQDGPINLTSDISFNGINLLFIYARGAGSTLTLASPILNSNRVLLNAEGSMRLMVGITAAERLKFIAGGDLVTTGPAGVVEFKIDNVGGTINNDGKISLQAGGNLSSQNLSLLIANNDSGHIGGSGNISVTTGGNVTAGSVDASINNRNGGSIGSDANVTFNIGGALTTHNNAVTDQEQESLFLLISNRNDGSGGGTISGDANLSLNAASVSVGGNMLAGISTNFGGTIGGSALNSFSVAGDLAIQGNADFDIQNVGLVAGAGGTNQPGGTISSDAVINLSAGNVSTGGYLDVEIDNNTGFGGIAGGMIGGDAVVNISASNISATDFFEAGIFNYLGHHIGGNATVNVDVSGNIESQSELDFGINNFDNGTLGGTIGLNAITTVHATNISSGGGLFVFTDNEGGHISGDAAMSLTASGNVGAAGGVGLGIFNEPNGPSGSPGSIGGNATIDVNAGNLSVGGGVLDVRIDNSNGGVIDGNATINMNVSGKATVTNDATFAILGSDGAGSAAVNINGGSYDASGTFLGFIDGNGAITFNNASVHANALNAGVFGTNGVLRIGGGTLSADSVLKLYAPGSNGQLNFVSNVTLGGTGTKILAANSVTIFNNVVVTIAGQTPADVYTNSANYSEQFGGNNSTTGTFAGAGANTPQPLASAPPFADPPPATSAATTVSARKTPTSSINVSNTDQLLSLLDATPGAGGKINIPGSKRPARLRNSTRTATDARLHADRPENRIAPRLLQ